ncbi:MAG TPA: YceI family protein [Candidatus Dormibacteraeota bacterium]|jgi:polyisoprenoid-binding protein YceI|nr:YceI family protein [Candidatus Dormibacteraeota bacterium]
MGDTKMSWVIEPSHSVLEFSARHLGISTVKGSFGSFTGSLDYDEEDPTRSTGTVEVHVHSLNTRDEKRDAHLRSADFFDADNHPKATFGTREILPAGEGRYKVKGDLTIRGTTRPVELDVELTEVMTDPWGNTRVGVSVSGTINRTDFGLNWNQVLEAGRLLVGEKVRITAEAELVRQEAAVAA